MIVHACTSSEFVPICSESRPLKANSQGHTPNSGRSSTPCTTLLRLDRTRYAEFIQYPPKGTVALTILVNGHKQEEAMQMIHAFWRIVGRYHGLRLQAFYLCYASHKHWLDEILEHCEDMEPEETNTRLTGCYGDKVATILALIGTRKQLCIFPEILHNLDSVRNGSVKNNNAQESQSSVGRGQSIGNALGFDSEDCATESQQLIQDDSATSQDPRGGLQSHERREKWTNHTTTSEYKDGGNQLDSNVEQISKRLGMWMDKLVDGSLRRYNVDAWPNWPHT